MVFDNYCVVVVFFMGLVFEEGMDFQDFIGDIGVDQIGLDGYCCDIGDKLDYQCEFWNM